MSHRIAGLILAGGRASRMGGRDKALVSLGDRPLLDHLLSRIRPQVDVLALSANGDPARFAAFGLPVVADTVPDFAGPLAGILAGLDWTASGTNCDRIVTAAVDTPFPPADLVERLSSAGEARNDTVAVARSGDARHPVFALWPVGLRDTLRHFLVERQQRRVWSFIEQQRHVEVDFPDLLVDGAAVDPFFNINTPSDLALAERILQGAVA